MDSNKAFVDWQGRDARTSTLESQKRMNLDSKGPLG